MSPAHAEPTDRDRANAHELARTWVLGDCTVRSMRRLVAHALADERARTLARFTHLADTYADTEQWGDVEHAGWTVRDQIRRAVEEEQG